MPHQTEIQQPSFREMFTPKLATILKEGYRPAHLKADAIAGLTVAIVALPLSMAIAIASGATPAQGLYTAIIGGFIVSALGGSRFQIGGPAGAFIVLVAATVQTHGMDGLLLATMLSGLILAAIGFLRLGTYIKFIPYPVTVGFTAGIGAIIFTSQIKDLLGLRLDGPEPGPLLEKLPALVSVLPTANLPTMALAAGTIAGIVVIKKLRPTWPAMLIAVVAASVAAGLGQMPVDTIGSRFGGIPTGLPLPSLPDMSWQKIVAVIPNAIAFALLGAIESLLSAVVADGMTGRRHRSNCELVAQGWANVASGLFGGICVTGTIARTATNVRSGAHGPVAGMLHSVILLLFVLVAAPLASYIPLAALAGILALVAWDMVEKHAIATLLRASRGDAVILLSTLLLTLFRDLTEAIVVGVTLGSVLFIHRMSKATSVSADVPYVAEDVADAPADERTPYETGETISREIVVYRITGAFFFGAAASIGAVLDHIAATPKTLVLDFSAVPFVDSTAAHTIEGMATTGRNRGVAVVITGTSPTVRADLEAFGLVPPLVDYADSAASINGG